MDSISYDHISGNFLSYDQEVQPIFLTFRLDIVPCYCQIVEI